jgi:hypothetical protein
MLSIHTRRYPATKGHRADVVSSVMASCDLCGLPCESSLQWDDTEWSQGLAHEHAKSEGWREQYKGRVQQLVCPTCQVTDISSAPRSVSQRA